MRSICGLAVALLGTAILCGLIILLVNSYDFGSWSRWYYIGTGAFALISLTPFSPLGGLIIWAMIIGAIVLGIPHFAMWVVIVWGILYWTVPPISNAIAGQSV